MSRNISIYEKKGLVRSVLNQLSYFTILGVSFWFNYKFVGGNNFFDAIIFAMFIMSIISKVGDFMSSDNYYKEVSASKIAKIKRILKQK